MIIVKLTGGLGNQLFQYAAGRRLAEHHNAPLRLDVRAFQTYHLRKYGLNHFKINAEIAHDDDFTKIGRIYTAPTTARIMKKMGVFHFGALVIERSLDFYPTVLGLPDGSYLDGYWQSEKYFQDIGDLIREELMPNEPMSHSSVIAAEKISQSNSVSVHIRRGDYAANAVTNKIHGVLSVQYYKAAIELIEKRVKSPHLFIFSDDPEWTKKNLMSSLPTTVIEGNGPEKNYEDMRLMSLCKHNIIANSSFSWWGAWLNRNSDKIVIAPQKWFNGMTISSQDRIPSSWLMVENVFDVY